MDLSVRTETFAQDDHSWLGSKHGTDMARPATLDVSTFTAAEHYPDGFLPSGLPLARLESGLYGLWATGGSVAGHLLHAVRVPMTGSEPTGADPVGALLDHGRVIAANLPVEVDAAGQATNPHITYV